MENQVKCPRCQSTQVSANKKGFSGTKAVTGAVLTGGLGLLAGTIGGNKIKITCLKCGYAFSPGDKPIYRSSPDTKVNPVHFAVYVGVLLIIMTIILLIIT